MPARLQPNPARSRVCRDIAPAGCVRRTPITSAATPYGRHRVRTRDCPQIRATAPLPRERPVQGPNPRMMTRDMPCQTAPEINWPQSRTTPGDCGLAWHDSGFGYQGSQVQILPIPPSITSCGSACARSSCASPPAGSPYPPEGAPTRATRPVCWSRSDPAAR